MLGSVTNSVFSHLQQERVIAPRDMGTAMMVKMHIDALWRSLGALRSYSSTTTIENGHAVRHSWLHVEDVAQ